LRQKQLNNSIMETNNIFDGAYSRIIEDEAWQRVSGDYPFSAEQLEQYKDRLDWHEVSGNRNISWTASMLEKFKRRLDWHELSRSMPDELYSAEILLKFKDWWDWNVISSSCNLSEETVSRVADYLVWREFISNYYNRERFTKEFYEKYKEYIPSSFLKGSAFYDNILEAKIREIKTSLSMQ